MVAFAPIVALAFTSVGSSVSGPFLIYACGFMSLVNTQRGPRKQLSSTVTRAHTVKNRTGPLYFDGLDIHTDARIGAAEDIE